MSISDLISVGMNNLSAFINKKVQVGKDQEKAQSEKDKPLLIVISPL